MGEEDKQPEEKKPEEKKPEEPKKSDEKVEEKKQEEPKETPAPPPAPAEAAEELAPPPVIILKVFMHCEGCAKKVRRCLRNFPGVEEVETDIKSHTVVVKGEKADPLAVLGRVQKKSHRHVELLSPIPKPPAEDTKKPEEKEAEKPPEKIEEPPQVITVVLKAHMHCEACAQEITRRILKMSGVEEVEPDLRSSQVTVKGVFESQKLVEYVHKRTGKHASIIKQEPEGKKEEDKPKEEKKAEDGGGGDKPTVEETKNNSGGDVAEAPPAVGGEEVAAANAVELRRNQFLYNYPPNYQIAPYPQNYHVAPYPPRYEMNPYHQYPPQMFSDENPNACSIM